MKVGGNKTDVCGKSSIFWLSFLYRWLCNESFFDQFVIMNALALALALVWINCFFSCLPRICRSCWRWCVFPSSTRPTCWTWWTTRSWLSPRRPAAIWSTKPSATTCSPTRGRRCRRPGLDQGSLPVSQAQTQSKPTREVLIITVSTINWQAVIYLVMFSTESKILNISPHTQYWRTTAAPRD